MFLSVASLKKLSAIIRLANGRSGEQVLGKLQKHSAKCLYLNIIFCMLVVPVYVLSVHKILKYKAFIVPKNMWATSLIAEAVLFPIIWYIGLWLLSGPLMYKGCDKSLRAFRLVLISKSQPIIMAQYVSMKLWRLAILVAPGHLLLYPYYWICGSVYIAILLLQVRVFVWSYLAYRNSLRESKVRLDVIVRCLFLLLLCCLLLCLSYWHEAQFYSFYRE